jgi:GTPase SAR1 family protein
MRHSSALQVVIVGNGAVGKSSMIQRYCKGVFTKGYKKTIGVDFLEKQLRYVTWNACCTSRNIPTSYVV